MLKEVFTEMSLMGSTVTYGSVIVVSLILAQFTLALHLIVGLAICLAIVWPIKYFFFKKRPDKTKYRNAMEKIDASSFPSTHCVRSVMLAFVIGSFFQNYLLYAFLLVLVLLNGFSRVYQKRHYVSDVVGGYVFGIIACIILALIL